MYPGQALENQFRMTAPLGPIKVQSSISQRCQMGSCLRTCTQILPPGTPFDTDVVFSRTPSPTVLSKRPC